MLKERAIRKITFNLILIIFLSGCGEAEVFFKDAGRQCLFSSIKGVITSNGEPAVGAKLIRTANRAKPRIDEAITNEKGYFEFPAVFERSITKYLPQEFVARQDIVVKYQGKDYEIWSSVKRDPKENTENRGNVLDVECELSKEEAMIMIDGVAIFGLCEWDVQPDEDDGVF